MFYFLALKLDCCNWTKLYQFYHILWYYVTYSLTLFILKWLFIKAVIQSFVHHTNAPLQKINATLANIGQ